MAQLFPRRVMQRAVGRAYDPRRSHVPPRRIDAQPARTMTIAGYEAARSNNSRYLKFHIKRAIEPFFEVVKSNTSEHTFQQRSSKTLSFRSDDTRTSALSPSKV
jgi:hypothetical protein